MAMQTNASGKIDRQAICPFHLKLFYRTGSFHSLSDFPTLPLPPHIQIYTWPDCTLRELSHLLTSALPSLLPDPVIGTRLAYRLVYPDIHSSNPAAPASAGRYMCKDLGSVVISSVSDEVTASEDDNDVLAKADLTGNGAKSLQDARFVIGDYIDVAILPPDRHGNVAQPPPLVRGRGAVTAPVDGAKRGGILPARENGYAGYRGRGGGAEGRLGGMPAGEWRRGERLPDMGAGRGYTRGRGRGW